MRALGTVALLALVAGGCGSTSPDGKNSYYPDSGSSSYSSSSSASSRERDPAPVASRSDDARASSPPVAESRESRASAPSTSRREREDRNTSVPATSSGEQPIGPVIDAPDGRKLVQLPSKGWYCDKCKRVYNSQGWCCGQEMLPSP